MALTDALVEARVTLGVSDQDDARTIKQRYRVLVVAHPPDRDPEAFRRVRDAFERLRDPSAGAREALLRGLPAVAPPELAVVEPAPRGATALALLRQMAADLDTTDLIDEDAS